MVDVEAAVTRVFGLLENYGDADYIGERVSQYEHAVQAALLAEGQGAGEEVVLAALFHDIGHLCEHEGVSASMDGYGQVDHERMGAEFLRTLGFSQHIANLVESHVEAKRYLVYANAEYASGLSEASLQTLRMQGGPMSVQEAQAFSQRPDFAEAVQLRLWDDAAKVVGMDLPPLDRFKELARRVLSATSV
jgi:phosphonate degradation associated HDIG domain protein